VGASALIQPVTQSLTFCRDRLLYPRPSTSRISSSAPSLSVAPSGRLAQPAGPRLVAGLCCFSSGASIGNLRPVAWAEKYRACRDQRDRGAGEQLARRGHLSVSMNATPDEALGGIVLRCNLR